MLYTTQSTQLKIPGRFPLWKIVVVYTLLFQNRRNALDLTSLNRHSSLAIVNQLRQEDAYSMKAGIYTSEIFTFSPILPPSWAFPKLQNEGKMCQHILLTFPKYLEWNDHNHIVWYTSDQLLIRTSLFLKPFCIWGYSIMPQHPGLLIWIIIGDLYLMPMKQFSPNHAVPKTFSKSFPTT